MLTILLWIIGAALAGYLALVLLIYLVQDKMIYFPTTNIHATPSVIQLDFEDVYLVTSDGVRLHGWFVASNPAHYTILFFHGNAGNIAGRLETLRLLHELDVNVLMIDYRGYGKSEGAPSEEGTYRDAEAAWKFLTEERGIGPDRIILMGRSLGGAVAAHLAAGSNPRALILEAAFTSAPDLASEIYGWLPVRQMIRFDYPTTAYLQQLQIPVLIMHSRSDQVIPFHHGEKLYEAANSPKYFLEMIGSHGAGFMDTGDRYIEALESFITSLGDGGIGGRFRQDYDD